MQTLEAPPVARSVAPVAPVAPPVTERSAPGAAARAGRSGRSDPGPRRRLFTVKEYEKLHRTGVLRPDERVELIEGEVIRNSPVGSPHGWVVVRLSAALHEILRESRHPIIVRSALILGSRSAPEPDLTILRPEARGEGLRAPRGEDALLVVEVSDSTLRTDLGPKARLYAKHGIPEYWVIDLAGRRAILHRDPSPTGYRTILEARPPEVIAPVALPKAGVDLGEVLRM